jgi:hypothetical protein
VKGKVRREGEGPAGMALRPCPNLLVIGGVIGVEDRMYDLAFWNIALDGVDKTDEIPMPMALHVRPEYLAGHDVQRREQRGRAVSLIVMVAPRRFLNGKPG